MPTHRINKVLLDFSFPVKEKDAALQKTRDLFYDKLLPKLTAQFDRMPGTLRIDKLEIDLGETTAENFENDFMKAFTESFHRHPHATEAARAKGLTPANKATGAATSAAGASDAAALLHFLKEGYWPWNYQQKPANEITEMVREQLKDGMFLQILLQARKEQLHSTTRLLHFISTDASLVKIFISALEKNHPAFTALLPLLPSSWKKKAFTEGNFYFSLLTKLLHSQPLKDATAMLQLVKELIPTFYSTAYIDVSGLLKITTTTRDPAIVLKDIFLLTEQAPALKEQDKATQPLSPAVEADRPLNVSHKDDEAEKIAIANAGLVLFHPFLPAVFRELGWVGADKKFTDGQVQRKAVLFLQLLVNGKSRQPEHELVLNKILCGWPIHLPLPSGANFSAREKNAVTDLIESLKEHWTVVKNTSNRGLVESFVSRPGLLQRKPKGYLLQVERKSVDILLDSLPLSLNIIKLPWNEQIIYTEW